MGPEQDREGRIVEGRFGPPSQAMEIWEHQGTMAAELAREDYALRRVGRPSHMVPQPFSREINGPANLKQRVHMWTQG